MKNLSLVLVALLLSTTVLADETKTEQTATLNSAAADSSINLKNIDFADLGAFLDKEVKEVSDLLSTKIAEELPELASKETAVDAKF